ncbi:MAG: SdrD B-like domain-containing protein [Rubricoccaceae bacterium]|nr:SdrD B-like domain-containing protein [Rubricoccaceae bacterium]
MVLTILAASSCNETSVLPNDSTGRITEGARDGLLLAEIAIDGGAIEIRATNLEWNEEEQTASFDVYLVNKGNVALEAPAHLAVSKVDPPDVSFQNPDGETLHGLPYKTYDEEFGDDGLLVPGERSGEDRFQFHTGEHRSFAIAFLLTHGADGVISGIVFSDEDEDGTRSAPEPGIGAVSVTLSYLQNNEQVAFNTTTNFDGTYSFTNLAPGVYSVGIDPPGSPTTANPVHVTLLEDDDGIVSKYERAHFGVHIDEGPVAAKFHLSGDVLCVPPFGSGDVPGSGGEVAVRRLPAQIIISPRVRGLQPNRVYEVYVMNLYVPEATRWEDRECSLKPPFYGPFVNYGTFQTNSHGDASLSINLGVEDVIPAGTYQLSVWINDDALKRTVLLSDSFELVIGGALSSRVLGSVSCSGTFSGAPPAEFPGEVSFAVSVKNPASPGSPTFTMRWPAFDRSPARQTATVDNNIDFAAIAAALTDGLAHVTAVEGALLHETAGWGSQPGASCAANSEQELFSLPTVDFAGATIDALHVVVHWVFWSEGASSKNIDFFVTVVVEGS